MLCYSIDYLQCGECVDARRGGREECALSPSIVIVVPRLHIGGVSRLVVRHQLLYDLCEDILYRSEQ